MQTLPKHLLFLLLLCSVHRMYCQSRGYVIIDRGDSTIYKQAWIDDNAYRETVPYVAFRIGPKLAAEQYSKDSIVEFGYEKGRRWIKKTHTINNNTETAFFEIIENGFYQLLYNKTHRKFYLGGDNLTELQHNHSKDKTYLEQLSERVDNCPNTLYTLPNIKYRAASLRYVVKNTNHSKCRAVPFASFGMVGGINRSTIQLSSLNLTEARVIDLQAAATGYVAGVFLEQPVWMVNKLSVIEEITYNNSNYYYTKTTSTKDYDVRIRLGNIQFAAYAKYAFTSARMRPFVLGGLAYGIIIDKDSHSIQASKNDDIIQINEQKDILNIKNGLVGVNVGAGLQYYYAPSQYISLQCRHAPLLGSEDFRLKNFHLLMNFNF